MSKQEDERLKGTRPGMVLPQQNSMPNLNLPQAAQKPKKEDAPLSPTDPDKMADALYGTGIKIKEEEALLHQSSERHKSRLDGIGSAGSFIRPGLGHSVGAVGGNASANAGMAPMINTSQVFGYVDAQLRRYGLKVPPGQERKMGEFLAIACEEMLTPILQDTVMYSRHRRRQIKTTNSGRGEVAKAIRDLAVRHKELEEKRTSRKVQLGIEQVGEGKGKPKAEELSHRAANATAALMTSGRTKTYSWMTKSSAPAAGVRGRGGDEKGVRYREARQEEIVSVRDFVRALENKRRGVDKTLVKSYSKLKDMYR